MTNIHYNVPKNASLPKLLMIYVHYNKDNLVMPFVFQSLNAFHELGVDIHFVSNSPIDDPAKMAKIEQISAKVDIFSNEGYDFYAWKHAILSYRDQLFAGYDRVLLFNSSVLGPVFCLKRFLLQIEAVPKDLVGATLSFQPSMHLQSYFLYFKPSIFKSDSFFEFWESVIPYGTQQEVIDHYEINLSTYFVSHGFTVGAYHYARNSNNPSIIHPYILLLEKFVFIKIRLIKLNPTGVMIWPLRLWIFLRFGRNFY